MKPFRLGQKAWDKASDKEVRRVVLWSWDWQLQLLAEPGRPQGTTCHSKQSIKNRKPQHKTLTRTGHRTRPNKSRIRPESRQRNHRNLHLLLRHRGWSAKLGTSIPQGQCAALKTYWTEHWLTRYCYVFKVDYFIIFLILRGVLHDWRIVH